MNSRLVRARLADAVAAAELLSDAKTLLALAVDAVSATCPHGVALAFTWRNDGTQGPAAARTDDGALPMGATRHRGPLPWVVDIEHVPEWQRDCWVEPMHAGVHGPDYFSRAHPVRRLIGSNTSPDYGRVMVCHHGRMVAWLGVYVDERRGFGTSEREALAAVAASLSLPLRIAAAIDCDMPRISLAPRQEQIVARVALGWTNKQIARELDVSPATVKTVLERLYRLSRVPNRTALAEWWRSGA